ncbi:MAG: ATP-dependent helicase, partial [Phaeodactylibacter sp.]|nr:ATP-dependent helicase [Phaeodactylibacter sp.]
GRFKRIEDLIERRVQRLPLPPGLATVEYASSGGGKGRGRSGGGKGRGRSSRGGKKGGKRGGGGRRPKKD